MAALHWQALHVRLPSVAHDLLIRFARPIGNVTYFATLAQLRHHRPPKYTQEAMRSVDRPPRTPDEGGGVDA